MTLDPGLQPERTRLSWRRTALAFTGVTALAARLAFTGDLAGALLGVVTILTWGTALAACWRRGTSSDPTHAGGSALPATALAAAGLALLGALLVLRDI